MLRQGETKVLDNILAAELDEDCASVLDFFFPPPSGVDIGGREMESVLLCCAV